MNQTHEPLADSMGVETIIQPEVAMREVSADSPRRRDPLLVRAMSILTLALLACLAVAGGWRKGFVLAPTDGLKLVAPWRAAGEDYRGANENLLDQTTQFVPWTIYTVERYKQGQIPLWNPNSQLGAPFLGNGQSAIFYPTILLHWFLPPEWSWTISAALRLFVAGLGVYLLAGRYGLRGLPRLFTSMAFMLCGFNVVWLNHPQMNVMPLLPWAVLMTEMLIERVRLHRILGAALVFFVQFLGGHPASCIHLLLACGLVWLLRIFLPTERAVGRIRRSLFSALGIGAAVVLGLALAAAQWLPLVEYAQNSGAKIVRAGTLKGQSLIATDPRYLIGLLFPYANGYPDGISPFEIRQATHLPNTNELAPGFVGTIPLILAMFAAFTLFRRREVRLWAIIALISAAIAIKFPGVDHLVRLIPGLNVAQNARLLVVTALGLAILSGLGLQELTTLLRQRVEMIRLRKTLKWCAISLSAIAVIAAIVLFAAKGPILRKGYAKAETSYKVSDAHEHNLDYVKSQVDRIHKEMLLTCARLMIPAAMFGLAAILLWKRARQTVEPAAAETGAAPENGNVLSYRTVPVPPKPKERRALGSSSWPWFGLALIDLLAFAIPYNFGAPAGTYFPTNVAAVRTLYSLPRHRLAGTFRSFIPETSTAYDLADIRGYDALAPARYYKWWKHPGIGDLPDYAQGYLNRLENPEAPAWSLLDFGYLITAADQPAPPEDKFTLIENGDENARLYQATKIRPRAWVAASAAVYPNIDPVLDRVAKMDFDPDETVLLDRDVAYDSKELADQDPTVWTRAALSSRSKPSVQFEPSPAKEGERPEVVTLRVTGASGGYLVLADTYFPGWSARVTAGAGGAQDVPILPANGVMRAIPLPRAAASVTVEMRYRPWSWRIGAAVSLGSIGLFVLLVGLTLIKPRTLDTSGETWPK